MIKKQKYYHNFITGEYTPLIELNMSSRRIRGGLRRLRTTWTPELVQDIEAYHNIDAEAELTALLTQQITEGIDREILNNVLNMGSEEHVYVDPIKPQHSILTIGQVVDRNTQRRVRENIIDKWSSSGFLDGLEGHVRPDIAQLYEGEASYLINEVTEPENGFDRVTFPIVRNVQTRLQGLEVVPVQPMEQPLGQLLYFVPNQQEENIYEVNWRTDETWEYEGLYGSKIGVTMNMLTHDFLPKKKSLFDEEQYPNLSRFR